MFRRIIKIILILVLCFAAKANAQLPSFEVYDSSCGWGKNCTTWPTVQSTTITKNQNQVLITAQVFDVSGVFSVVAKIEDPNNPGQYLASQIMYDDGSHFDGSAHDLYYGATLNLSDENLFPPGNYRVDIFAQDWLTHGFVYKNVGGGFSILDDCVSNWDCSWSECVNGSQTATCTDLNHCATPTNPPALQRACSPEVVCSNFLGATICVKPQISLPQPNEPASLSLQLVLATPSKLEDGNFVPLQANWCMPVGTKVYINYYQIGETTAPVCEGETLWSGPTWLTNGQQYQLSINPPSFCSGYLDYDGTCYETAGPGKDCCQTCAYYGTSPNYNDTTSNCSTDLDCNNNRYNQNFYLNDQDCNLEATLMGSSCSSCHIAQKYDYFDPTNKECWTAYDPDWISENYYSSCKSSADPDYPSAGMERVCHCQLQNPREGWFDFNCIARVD